MSSTATYLTKGACWRCGRKGLHFCLSVERSDWVRSPGRSAVLQVGPFWFAVNTADGGLLCFSIASRWLMWSWHLEGNPRID